MCLGKSHKRRRHPYRIISYRFAYLGIQFRTRSEGGLSLVSIALSALSPPLYLEKVSHSLFYKLSCKVSHFTAFISFAYGKSFGRICSLSNEACVYPSLAGVSWKSCTRGPCPTEQPWKIFATPICHRSDMYTWDFLPRHVT